MYFSYKSAQVYSFKKKKALTQMSDHKLITEQQRGTKQLKDMKYVDCKKDKNKGH